MITIFIIAICLLLISTIAYAITLAIRIEELEITVDRLIREQKQ